MLSLNFFQDYTIYGNSEADRNSALAFKFYGNLAALNAHKEILTWLRALQNFLGLNFPLGAALV